MGKQIICILLLISCVLPMANRGTEMITNKYVRISASAAREKMLAYPGAVILDVRSSREFATGRIPGAVLIPDYALHDKARTAIPNKNALILVYCRSGVRSQDAAYTLLAMGYTNVFDFGGIIDWPYDIVRD